jgi:hypothetical protein
MDFISNPQVFEMHVALPAFDPHLGPNGQGHLAAMSPRQCDRAFA